MSDTGTGKYEILDVDIDSQAPRFKKCVFCAETIQAEAIKCRFCGEFLNTDKARQLSLQQSDQQDTSRSEADGVLFAARPSLLGLFGSMIKAAIFIALVIFMVRLPLEDYTAKIVERFSEVTLSDSQYYAIAEYKKLFGFGLVVLVLLHLLLRALWLKMSYYEVTSDRVEYSRGILDRRVDNIDMFRVIDLKLRRSLLDCLLGIGRVTLITTDKTDPEFSFEKVRDSRRLYDVIKRASLKADQRQGVVHIE